MAELEKNGISVRQGTHAVHTLGYYKNKYGLGDHDYPISYIADRLSITLPLYFGITEEQQLEVVTCLKELISDGPALWEEGINKYLASKHLFLNPFFEKNIVKPNLFPINIYDILFLKQGYRLLY